MWQDQLQRQRFERKYLLTEQQATLAREIIRCYLVPDEFSRASAEVRSYQVHSLYLDSPDLLTYWAWVCCEKKRFKLRIRYYDENADSPLFFEIKRRENDCILKQRALVRRSAAAALLAGELPTQEHLLDNGPDKLAALQRFCELMRCIGAEPVVHVGYIREAWRSTHGNSVRATFDRAVKATLQRQAEFTMQLPNAFSPFQSRVILELKFTDRFPHWCRDLVQRLELVSAGVPKYCSSVAGLFGEETTAHEPAGLKERLAQLAGLCYDAAPCWGQEV